MSSSADSQEGLRTMLRIASPIIVINVSMTLMQFVDAFMVAALGEKELAASLPAGLMFFVPIAFMMGVLGSVNTFVAQVLGQRKADRCGHYAWQGIYLGVIAGVAMLFLWFIAEPLFALFGHDPEVQKLEVVYFRICLFEGVPLLVGVAISNFFIGIQRTRILAWFAVMATLLNIFFNWVFIFGNLGAPALGLAGAAVGTVLAISIQTMGLLGFFLRPALVREFETRFRVPDIKSLADMLRIGLPAGVQFGFDILSWGVALVWMVGLFGTASLAATTIVVRYMHVGFMPAMALASALIAMVGKAIGEGNPDLAERYVKTALRVTTIYMGAVGILFFVMRYQLLSAFTDSEETIALGVSVMLCVAFFQYFDALNIIYSHALRAAGDTLWLAVVGGVICLVVFIGGGVAIINFLPGLGGLGPWLMGTVYLSLFSLMMRSRWRRGTWRQLNIFKESGGDTA